MEHARESLKQLLKRHQGVYLGGGRFKELNEIEGFQQTAKFVKWFKIVVGIGLLSVLWSYYHAELQGQRCLLSLPKTLSYAFRPPETCDFCSHIKSIPHLSQLSPQSFEADYAYSGTPIIVSDAMQNWTATKIFNFEYFRNVYRKVNRKQSVIRCQFLPYKTGFRDIYEALDLPKERMQSGAAPWYFGWSNCHAETTEEFRKHYGRPYFLPESAENKAVDWIFIGTAGMGAQMHIDNVRYPSWQAQLAGSKRWLLVPPPECYLHCKKFEVVVQQGDIIVLDTNKWYHQTIVQPGEISITIGAEYD